jgi:mannose-6-phosphate isomerase-like protein (cupin superfamily)
MEKILKLYEIKRIATPNFVMSPIELKDYIDFEVKRVYFITDPKGPAGGHCHKTEKEFFILAKGTATAIIDRGQGLERIPMIGPTTGLYIGEYTWHYFEDFSPDAVLLALSSTNYDSSRADYIEDYEKYKKIA